MTEAGTNLIKEWMLFPRIYQRGTKRTDLSVCALMKAMKVMKERMSLVMTLTRRMAYPKDTDPSLTLCQNIDENAFSANKLKWTFASL